MRTPQILLTIGSDDSMAGIKLVDLHEFTQRFIRL
jgi:hypothetical protein